MSFRDSDIRSALEKSLHDEPQQPFTLLGVQVQGDDVRITFHLKSDEATQYAVVYSLTPFVGANTGWELEDLAHWADEVKLDLDEKILTGGVARALRSAGGGGTVVLQWR